VSFINLRLVVNFAFIVEIDLKLFNHYALCTSGLQQACEPGLG